MVGLSRRQLLRATAGATLAPALSARGRAEDQRQLTIALLADHLPKLAPLFTDYTRRTGIAIVPDAQPLDALSTRVSISLTQGTNAYDVVSIYETWVPQFAHGKTLSGLGDLVEVDESGSSPDYVPSLLALGKLPGQAEVKAIPWNANAQVFVARTDVLAGANLPIPTTWIDVMGCARTLAARGEASGVAAYGMRAAGPMDASLTHWPLLRGLGCEVIDATNGQSLLASPEAMMSISDLVELARLSPGDLDEVGQGELGELVAEGRIALCADIWVDQLFRLFDPAQSRVADRMAVAWQPARPWLPHSSVTGAWLLAAPGAGHQRADARDFIRWLTDLPQQRRLLREHQVVPTRSAVFRDPDVRTSWPFLGTVRAMLSTARPRPRSALMPAVEEIHGAHVREAILGAVDGAEAMRRAHLEILELMVREGVIEE